MSGVAVLGLGRMGARMAQRLADAGHELAVYNRTPRRDRVPAGARLADSPADAARGAQVVITMVADGPALLALLAGPEGVLATIEPDAVVVDMSTIGRDHALDAASRCAQAGGTFIDAPVSGSTAAAASGGLTAFVGGSAETLDRVRPVLAVLTREQLHIGPVGAGQSMKLAVNLLLAVTNQGVAELIAQTSAAGIPPATAYTALSASALASPFLGYVRDRVLDPADAPVAFSIDLMVKDVSLALDSAARTRAPAEQGTTSASALRRAIAQGRGPDDFSTVVANETP